jgi:NADPH:quinone reductase-like Zn-dependent oxidoreductase
MKAVVYDRYGPPEVLRVEDVPKPAPREDEVVVEVRASSINSWDWDLLLGTFQGRLGFMAFRKPKMKILGADIAGVVESTGAGVTRFRPGDAVFGDISGSGWGGFAEYAAVRGSVLAPKSEALGFDEAASLPQAGVLALQGLRNGQRTAAKRVLINGAGGGVGTLAVQIATSRGAHVTGVDRAGKLPALRSLGADEVIDFEQSDFTRTGERYDVILDVSAGRSILANRRALAPAGRYVAVGGKTGSILGTLAVGPLLSMTGDRTTGVLVHRPNPDDLVALNDLVERGDVTPVIDGRYPLEQVPAALRRFGEGGVIGKLVITMG